MRSTAASRKATPGAIKRVASFVAAALVGGLLSVGLQPVSSTSAADTPPFGVCYPPTVGEVNTSWPLVSDVASGATAITISMVVGDQIGAAGAPRVNDLFLISQVMNASINTTNTSAYGANNGTGRGYTSLGRTGLWEYARVQSFDAATGVVKLQSAVTGNYLTTGTARAQVTRVPEFADLTLTADLTAPSIMVVSGDRVAGGVVAVSVSGTLNLNGFSIHADALGFLGGARIRYTSTPNGLEYVSNVTSRDGGKGLSIAATFADLQGSLGGAYAQGAPANGGGGGGDTDGPGAGGGNGGAGGSGGAPWAGSARSIGGAAVTLPVGETLAQRLIMGGGGGGGNGNDNTQTRGGQGGGVVIVDAGTIINSGLVTAGNGEIRANGQASTPSSNDASGGGGAGGTVLVRSGVGVPSTVDLLARGGGTTASQNTGSAGGGGRIVTSSASLGAVNVTKGTTTGSGTGAAGDGLSAVASIQAPPVAPPPSARTCDFGDLPDLTGGTATGDYQTLAANGYPAHYGVGVRLGANRDSENDALQNSTATGDAGDDGVAQTYIPRNATSLTVPVSVQNVTTTSCVVGYLDVNRDGDFADIGESSVGVSNVTVDGPQNLTFTGLSGLSTLGQTIALRVRVTSDATFCAAPRTVGARSIGWASDGEIEDYLLPIAVATDIAITKTLASPTAGTVVPGGPIGWSVTITNNGPGNLVSPGVLVEDALPSGVSGSWTCTVVSGTAACPTLSGTNLNANVVTMNTAAVMRFTFAGTASSNIPSGTISNTATVKPNGAGIADTNAANNSATAVSPVQATSDLVASKTSSALTAFAGGLATFTLSATNNGPHAALNATVADSLPAGFTVVSLTSSQSGVVCNTMSLSCSVPSLASGDTLTATLVANVPATAAAGTVTNSMVASTSSVDPVSANNTSSATVTVVRSSDLAVVIGDGTGIAGQSVSVPVTATNNGPTATGATVTVPVPAGLAFSLAGSTAGCTLSGANVSCVTGSLAAGVSTGFVLVFMIPAAVDAGDTPTSAQVTAVPIDDVPGNNSDVGVITVTTSADLSISKVLDSEPVVAGGTSSWTVTVTNNGPSVARDVEISDTLPSGLSITEITAPAGVTCAGGDFPCTADNVAPGQSLVLGVSTMLDADTAEGTEIVNAASVSSTTPDPVDTNNGSSDSGTTAIDVDLQISKTVTPATVNAGESAEFQLTVFNDGLSQATDITVTDTLPAGLTVDGAIAPPAGTSCTVTGQDVTCTAASLAPGGTITVALPVLVASTAPAGPLSNEATVTTPTSSATISAGLTISRAVDLSLTKALATPGAKVAGVPFDITLNATNAGPSSATNVRVIDTLPPGMTFVSGAGCTASGSQVTCEAATIDAGESNAFTVTVLPSATTPAGVLTNNASVSADEGDTNGSDNSTSLDTEIEHHADLALTKTDSIDPGTAGGTLTYTLGVTNYGPSVATGVVVTDTLPTGLTFVAGGSTSACTAAGQVVTCTLAGVSINPGESVSVGAAVLADASLPLGTVLTNVASVSGAGTDDDTANNSATETTTINAKADLTITKTVTSESVVPGMPVVWQIEVTNHGPSVAQNVVVSDPLDPRVTFVTDDPGASGPESSPECDADGAGLVTCALGTLDVGTTTVQIVGHIAGTATGTLNNTATLTTTTPGSCLGAVPCTSTANSTLTPQTALTISKSVVSDGPLAPGGTVVFGIQVSNAGPSSAAGVVVSDTLPTGLTFVPAQSTASCTANGQVITCALGTLATTATVEIAATIDAAQRGSISNTATVSSPTGPSCLPASPCASTVGPLPLVPQADLIVQKSTQTAPIVAGGLVVFDITVQNGGLSDATRVVITDTLAAGMTFVSATAGCSTVGQVVSCVPVTIQAGDSVTSSITVRLAPGYAGPLSNIATVTTPDDPDCVSGCSGSLQPEPVERASDLSITASVPTIIPGSTAPLTLTIDNLGISDVPGALTVDFTAPDGTSVVTTPSGCTAVDEGRRYTCAIAGPFTVSDLATLEFELSVPASTEGNTDLEGGTAEVSSATDDPELQNNTDTVAVRVGDPNAQIRVSKALDSTPLVPGESNSFTITVQNDGPSIATNVVISDVLDPAFTFLVGGSDDSCGAINQTVTCEIGTVPVGTSTVTVAVAVNPGLRSAVGNTANISTDTDGTCATGCDAPTGPLTPQPNANLSITKTLETPELAAGNTARWTIDVTNDGPSDATDVVVSDDLDPRLTFVPFDGTEGSSAQCTVTGQAVTCDIDNVAAGESESVTVIAMLAPSATGSLTNVAVVTSPDDSTCDEGCASDPSTTDIATLADLAVTSSGASIVPGSTSDVVLHLDNLGPSSAAGPILIVFTPPNGTSVTSAPDNCVESAGGTWTCTVAGPIAVTDPAIDFTFTLSVPDDHEAGELIGTVAITGAGTDDPVTANNDDEVTVTVLDPRAALSVTKTLDTSQLIPGTPAVWTVKVHNDGPSIARGITITDALDPVLTFIPFDADDALTSSEECSASGQNVTCVTDEGVVGDTIFRIAVQVDPAARGSITNVATATSPTDPACEDGCEATSGPDALDPDAHLSITKSLLTSPLVAGQPIAYAVTVQNAGPSSATDVSVTDTVPAGFLLSAADSSEDCDVAGSTLTCQVDELAPNAQESFTVAGTLAADAKGATSNTATVTSPDDELCSEGCSITSGPHEVGVVVDAKVTAATPTLTPGTSGVMTLSAANDGPSTATGFTVVYTPPVGVTITSVPVGCTATGSPVGATYTCTTPTVAPGTDPITYDFGVAIDPEQDGPTTLEGVVSVSTDQQDSDTGNNSAPANIEVNVPEAPLTITKELLSSAPLTPGKEATWEIIITNAGPSTARNVVVTDTLDDALHASAVSDGCEIEAQTVTCTAAKLAPGSMTFTITAGIDPKATADISNSATVSSDTAGGCPQGCTATSGPHELVPEVSVHVVKSLVTGTVVAGANVGYTFTATNSGPSNAAQVVISDELDSRLTFNPAESSEECTAENQTVTCTITNLSGEATLSIVATLASGATGTLSNTAAFATPEQPECASSCLTNTVTTEITAVADLEITASPPSPQVPGGTFTIEYSVMNHGPSDAGPQTVAVMLPAGLEVSAPPAECMRAGDSFTCVFPETLAPGDPARTLTFHARVPSSATPGTTQASANVTSPTNDIDLVNNAVQVPIVIADPGAADLEGRLTSGEIVQGAPGLIRVTVINHGPAKAIGPIIVTMVLPDDTSYTLEQLPQCSRAGSKLTCAFDRELDVNDVLTFDVGIVVNTTGRVGAIHASVTAMSEDPIFENNHDTLELAPVPPQGSILALATTGSTPILGMLILGLLLAVFGAAITANHNQRKRRSRATTSKSMAQRGTV